MGMNGKVYNMIEPTSIKEDSINSEEKERRFKVLREQFFELHCMTLYDVLTEVQFDMNKAVKELSLLNSIKKKSRKNLNINHKEMTDDEDEDDPSQLSKVNGEQKGVTNNRVMVRRKRKIIHKSGSLAHVLKERKTIQVKQKKIETRLKTLNAQREKIKVVEDKVMGDKHGLFEFSQTANVKDLMFLSLTPFDDWVDLVSVDMPWDSPLGRSTPSINRGVLPHYDAILAA